MGKIICEVCGTSYSDAATQCPICGYVSPVGADISAVANHETESTQPKYEHVRGGRFSKANVKKRNKRKPIAAVPAEKQAVKKNAVEPKEPVAQVNVKPQKETKEKSKKKDNSNRGLVITVLILLLAIIAVIGYIAVTFILPVVKPQMNKPADDVVPTGTIEPTIVQDVVCTDIVVDPLELVFEAVGETAQIVAVPVPANVTEGVTYTSVDTTVATVDANGLVTAVGAGSTEITVACGNIRISCSVTVNEEPIAFFFDQDEVILEAIGDECLIYTGAIAVSDITWRSDDELVATIHDGIVVAVGNGTTVVYGEYEDMIISCEVTCAAAEETEPTEDMAAIEANGPYRLHNPYGVSDTDASIKLGVSFTLYLLDKNDEKVSGVVWSVENGSSCKVVDGKVTGIAKGNCDVVATYGGKTYTCIVRVS